MTDLTKLFKGLGFFILGYILIIIMNSFLPTLVSTLETDVFAGISDIIWFGIIIVWVIFALALPIAYVITALQTLETKNKFMTVIVALAIFIFNIIFTIKAWYMIPTFSAFADEALIGSLFWVGLIIQWVMIQLGIPLYMITKAMKT